MSAEPEKTANLDEDSSPTANQEPEVRPEVHSTSGATSSADAPLAEPAAPEPGGKASKGSKSGKERPVVNPDGYNVFLPTFEGPLDLLLHLIQQHELDIRDIPIAFVSQKYVQYITMMQELNIDIASEYLVMAATLAHIKSKMLLPAPPTDQEDEANDDFDPRTDLVRRLLEYQKYKKAAAQLGSSAVLGRDVFLRGVAAPEVDGPAPLAQVSVFKLFDAFQRILGRVQQTADHHIDVDRISISERILQLTDLLKEKGRTNFEQLFEGQMARSDLVVTFLAILEMTRLRMLQVFQEAALSPILVELTLTDEHDELLQPGERSEDPLAMLESQTAPEPVAEEPGFFGGQVPLESGPQAPEENEAEQNEQDSSEESTDSRTND